MSKSEIEIYKPKVSAQIHAGGSSKGLQIKYYEDDFWYKEDNVGDEGITETLVSRIVNLTNANLRLVRYSFVQIYKKKRLIHDGCKSKSFLKDKETEVTLARLLEKHLGLSHKDSNFPRGKALLDITMSLIKNQDLRDKLSCLLQLDRLVLNEDRHLNNIVFIVYDNQITDVVSFDYGDSLGSDTYFDFPEDKSAEECIQDAVARPFNTSYDKQCEMLREYSNFELQLTSNELYAADLMDLIPPRMLDILRLNVSRCFNTNIKINTGEAPGTYSLGDLEHDATTLMQVISKYPDYRVWFTQTFPNDASSANEVLYRLYKE